MHFSTLFLTSFYALAATAVPAYPVYDENASAYNGTAPIGDEAQANMTANNQALIPLLESAPTAVDRLALLTDDSANFVYDFNAPPSTAITSGDGGHTVKSDRQQFPALIGTGVSMTLGFLGPCGFNTPHTHPRSSEINVVAEGALVAEMIAENGAKIVRNRLDKFQMTVFPQGALHTEFNPECEDAVFVAGFASEDPGVLQAAQSFLGLDDDVIAATAGNMEALSGADIDKFRSVLPKNVAKGVESCLKKCNIAKR